MDPLNTPPLRSPPSPIFQLHPCGRVLFLKCSRRYWKSEILVQSPPCSIQLSPETRHQSQASKTRGGKEMYPYETTPNPHTQSRHLQKITQRTWSFVQHVAIPLRSRMPSIIRKKKEDIIFIILISYLKNSLSIIIILYKAIELFL